MAYVYQIVVKSKVRYIGKGNDDRAERHLRIMRMWVLRILDGGGKDAPDFYRRLAQAAIRGDKIEIKYIAQNLTEDEGYAFEAKQLVKHRPTLWGGYPAGRRKGWSEEHRTQQSALLTAAWHNPKKRKAFQEGRQHYYESRFKVSVQKQVLDLLKKYPAGLKPREIADKLNLIGAQQQNILTKLRRKGLINRHGDNHYEYRYTLK